MPIVARIRAVVLSALTLMVMTALTTTVSFGQNASFTGRVMDPTGAVVPGASVTVRNLGTGVNLTIKTTGTGNYTLPYLTSGQYTVTVTAPGFKTESRANIQLQTAQVAVVDFTLRVGSTSESVVVDASGSLLDRGKADRGEIFENTRVTELPLNGRNPIMLDRLNAAVLWDGNVGAYQRPFDGQVFTNLHVNGSDPSQGPSGSYSTEVMLDGAPDQTYRPQNTGHQDVAQVVPEDSVQDFKIVTNAYDSQYGRTRGGVVDETLKSGTNKFHGDVYEFARRTWLDANLSVNDYIIATHQCGTSCANYGTRQHKLDQYGFELDGPVRIPNLYNGTDKTFFLMQFENWNEIMPNTVTTSVPDPTWYQSIQSKGYADFSNLIYQNNPVTIYNPYDTYLNSKGNMVRNPFPNNHIPASMINPVALKMLSYYPKPNTVGLNGTPWQNNYITPSPTQDRYRNALIKIDQNFSASDRFSIRYGYWERLETVNSNGVTGIATHGEYPLGDRSHTFALEYTHVFKPTLFFDYRAMVNVKGQPNATGPSGFDLNNLGYGFGTQLGGFNLFPGIAASGFTTLGANGATADGMVTTNSLSMFPSLTWVKGKHNFHFGVDLRLYQNAQTLNPGTSLSFGFNQQWTQSCWSCGAGSNYSGTDNGTEGNAIASMLLGLTSSGTDNIYPNPYFSQHYFAPFVQDDWKFSKKLTLNLGVRWDVQPPLVERHNIGDGALATTGPNPIDSSINTSGLPSGFNYLPVGGVTFLGMYGQMKTMESPSWWDIQPRVGFAYAIGDRLVLRGGIGEFFQNTEDEYPNYAGFWASTTSSSSTDGNQMPLGCDQYVNTSNCASFGGNLSNPFPTGLNQPLTFQQAHSMTQAQIAEISMGGTPSPNFVNPNYRVSNTWQMSFGLEQQLAKNDTLEISAVRTVQPNRYGSQNINHWGSAPGTAGIFAACNVQMGGAHEVCDSNYSATNFLGKVPNPYYHVPQFIGTSDYSSTTIGLLTFTQQMPQYGGVTEYGVNNLRSWYNSLQVTYQHRWSNQLTVHATWNWSKLMDSGGWADNNYLVPQRIIDGTDRTHNITLSGVWDMPVGRGRTYLRNVNRFTDWALGGWEFSPMAIFQSGAPWSFSGWDYVHNAKLAHPFRMKGPITNGGQKMGAAGNIQWFEPCFYHTNPETGALVPTSEAIAWGCTQPDFIQIPSYGVQPNIIYSGIRQPFGYWFDTNLSKNFKVTESSKIQFRLECFNVLNHPLWQNGFYGDNQYGGEIGRSTGSGQSNAPRYVQLGLKYSW